MYQVIAVLLVAALTVFNFYVLALVNRHNVRVCDLSARVKNLEQGRPD